MEYLVIIVVIVIALNLFVSVYLAKRDDLNRFQKVAQILIVWLVPLVGALGLWQFHRSQDNESIQAHKRTFGGGTVDSAGSGD